MVHVAELTLSEISKRLNVSQHRLIYLCESHVVHPDIEGPDGRGSSRRFSARNLLEFAIALKLKDLTLPVAAIAAIVYVLRKFEVLVAQDNPEFRLPDSLSSKTAPDLRIIIRDGRFIYFALIDHIGHAKLYGGLDLLPLAQAHIDPPVFHRQQLLNLARMMETVRKSRDPLSQYVQRLVPTELDKQLQKVKLGRYDFSQSGLVDQLNHVLLMQPDLYDVERVAHIDMTPRVRRLIETKGSQRNLVLVNRLVLQLAYRKELGVSHRSREWIAALAAEPHDTIEPVALDCAINPVEFGSPEGSRYARIEVSVNNIARDLPTG